MSITAKPPYKYFTEADGSALESGKIYVGVAGLDAEANPVTAYWDSALTIAAAQPIRTIGGAPDNSGTPSDFFTAGDYSITVRDKNDVLVYSKLQLNANDPDNLNLFKIYDTVPLFLASTEGARGTGATVEAGDKRFEEAAPGAPDNDEVNAAGVKFYDLQKRTATAAAVLAGQPNNYIGILSGLPYLVDSTAIGALSTTNDLSVDGLVPFGTPFPQHRGSAPARADTGLSADNSAAIQYAIDNFSSVTIPNELRVDSMIELSADKVLVLGPLGGLTRTNDLTSTDPVVWLKGTDAAIFGHGMRTVIKTENRAPLGVVRIGHADMTASHANVNFCTVKDVWIAGMQQNGQTTGDNDAAMMICNPQFSGLTSYFHTLDNVGLVNANYGLWLRGFANANKINNIHMQKIGNATLDAIALYLHGALDNAITNVFVHSSTNVTCIKFLDLDNTGAGGSNHVASFNNLVNFQAEPGGSSEFLVAGTDDAGVSNYVQGAANTASFGSQTDLWREQNTIVTAQLVKFKDIKRTGDGDIVTIATGSAAMVDLYHIVAAESGVSDDLDTITGTNAGDIITLGAASGDTITVRDNGVSGGNITLAGDVAFTMTGGDRIQFISDGSFLRELTRSDN